MSWRHYVILWHYYIMLLWDACPLSWQNVFRSNDEMTQAFFVPISIMNNIFLLTKCCVKSINAFKALSHFMAQGNYGIMRCLSLLATKCLSAKWFLMKWHRSFFVPMSIIITNLQLKFDWKKMKKKTFYFNFWLKTKKLNWCEESWNGQRLEYNNRSQGTLATLE